MTPTRWLLLAAAIALAGCAQYATVSEIRPRFRPIRDSVGALGTVERGIAKALTHQHAAPLSALGEYLSAAESAAQALARNPPQSYTQAAAASGPIGV